MPPRELGDVAGLAGHLVGVVVDPSFLCGREPWQDSQVARLWSSCFMSRPCIVLWRCRVAAARGWWALKVWQSAQTMLAPSRAICTSLLRRRVLQRGVQVAVLDASPPPPLKWQAPQLCPAGLGRRVGDLVEVRGLNCFCPAGLPSARTHGRQQSGWPASVPNFCRCPWCRGRPDSPHCSGR